MEKKSSGKFHSGKYKIINPEKYIGDSSNIFCRSSWETKFCHYCDTNNKIVKWTYEHKSLVVDYYSPIDKKFHKYWIDFYIKIQKMDGEFEEYMLEVKPIRQYEKESKPVLVGNASTKKLEKYNEQLKVWLTNQYKFKAAIEFASKRGAKFKICDENFLFN